MRGSENKASPGGQRGTPGGPGGWEPVNVLACGEGRVGRDSGTWRKSRVTGNVRWVGAMGSG